MRQKIKRSYDRIGSGYVRRRRADGDVELLEEIIDRVEPGAPVLDAGCGAGIPVLSILSDHFTAYGVDISPEQLKLARENVPSASLVCQDVSRLPFPDETFAAICLYYVLFNVPREDHRGVLEEFYRTLQPGGLLLFDAGTSPTERKSKEDWLGTGIPMYWSRYDTETYLDLVERIGFEVVWLRWADHKLDSDERREHPFVLARKPTDEDR